MRKYLSGIILSLTIPLGELHTLFRNNHTVQNWIWHVYRPMTLDWNITQAVNELNSILYFLAWLLYVRNKANRAIIKGFFCLAIMDAIMYFCNYKTEDFGSVYFWYAGFCLFFYKGIDWFKWIYKHFHP